MLSSHIKKNGQPVEYCLWKCKIIYSNYGTLGERIRPTFCFDGIIHSGWVGTNSIVFINLYTQTTTICILRTARPPDNADTSKNLTINNNNSKGCNFLSVVCLETWVLYVSPSYARKRLQSVWRSYPTLHWFVFLSIERKDTIMFIGERYTQLVNLEKLYTLFHLSSCSFLGCQWIAMWFLIVWVVIE